MSTIDFSDILAQAGKVDKKFEDASPSTESEEIKTCEDLVSALKKLTNAGSIGKERVVYFTLQGDALAYTAAVSQGSARKKSSDAAREAYKCASDVAITDLEPVHPDRLRLALNYSVFLHDIAEEKDRACHTAKSAFDDAIAELDTLSEESYADSTRYTQLLRDRLSEWVAADEVGVEGGVDGGVDVDDE